MIAFKVKKTEKESTKSGKPIFDTINYDSVKHRQYQLF